MDKKKIGIQVGESGLIIGLFLAFIVVACLLVLFFGPTAPKIPDLNCTLANNITYCHL
jgi:hypothetical protein